MIILLRVGVQKEHLFLEKGEIPHSKVMGMILLSRANIIER